MGAGHAGAWQRGIRMVLMGTREEKGQGWDLLCFA